MKNAALLYSILWPVIMSLRDVGTWVAVAVGFRGAGRRSGETALCQGHGSCGVLGLFDAAAF